jgi:hypothetical protein
MPVRGVFFAQALREWVGIGTDDRMGRIVDRRHSARRHDLTQA